MLQITENYGESLRQFRDRVRQIVEKWEDLAEGGAPESPAGQEISVLNKTL